ncbi:MAG TPA: YidB family protein [Burkholderiaceae bacterium]|nr:YidB family protein [Burkholderiaceae bacterium]
MGLFDSALGMLGGAQQADDPKAKLLQAAAALLSNNSQVGGLPGLLDRFQQAGLGNVVGSWIATGQNQPISPEQVQQVLGDDQLEQVSQQTGVPPEQAASHLSELLPSLIDKLTPNGEVPQGGLGQVGALLGQLLGRH